MKVFKQLEPVTGFFLVAVARLILADAGRQPRRTWRQRFSEPAELLSVPGLLPLFEPLLVPPLVPPLMPVPVAPPVVPVFEPPLVPLSVRVASMPWPGVPAAWPPVVVPPLDEPDDVPELAPASLPACLPPCFFVFDCFVSPEVAWLLEAPCVRCGSVELLWPLWA
ncbi:hypothetical protein EYF70_05855 [Pseudoduganella albidiflava]|uniref:DUF4573 domain-containing protein n=1 Tax=Pseudoduganella albidiflava TaxID=321983 RepID=A0ABX5RRG6_9BURK|nr:hypothetical protein EYF70_05855 [Pseudoduganella albidiflava]